MKIVWSKEGDDLTCREAQEKLIGEFDEFDKQSTTTVWMEEQMEDEQCSECKHLQHLQARVRELEKSLLEKRKVFKKAATKAMSHRKNSERKLNKKIKELEKKNIELQQINSFFTYRSCGLKVTYNAKLAESLAIQRGQRKYKCKFCNGWHLASKKDSTND